MNCITMLPWDNEHVSQFLVNFYHSLPHIDITFKLVNSTFNPKSTPYLEVLSQHPKFRPEVFNLQFWVINF